MTWTKDGKRKDLPLGICHKANTVRETDGKTYCLGYENPMNDEPIEKCASCTFYVKNQEDWRERYIREHGMEDEVE